MTSIITIIIIILYLATAGAKHILAPAKNELFVLLASTLSHH
jgi:hypothetical protein